MRFTSRRVSGHAKRRAVTALALFSALAMAAAACGSSGSKGGGSGGGNSNTGVNGKNIRIAAVTPSGEGTPKPGGKIVYGLEGNTDNFCLPSAQLSIDGIMVVQAIYDTLTEPDANGNYVPYLAKTVGHDSTYKVWTIGLRSGIKFQDGETLDGNAVAQNIEAWRKGLLLSFVFGNIDSVQVTGPLTLQVTMKTPWVAFPAYLYASGRVGVAAPAQLNNKDTCATNMIGTGPFKLKTFDPQSGSVDVVKNPDYWRKGYPYLDEIDFRVQEDGQQRVNGLLGGQYSVMIGNGGNNFDTIRKAGSKYDVILEPQGRQEVNQVLLNVSKPPLNDVNVRRAIAMGSNRTILNQISNGSNPLWRVADQIFDTKTVGNVPDGQSGFPAYNPTEAKKLIQQYVQAHGGKPLSFDMATTYDTTVQAIAQEVKREAAQLGVTVNLTKPTDQGTIISQAVGGAVDAFFWRNYAGGDPDTMYVWFHSGSPVNFNHINDPTIDKDLQTGRENPDPAARKAAYQDFDKRLNTEAYTIWGWYSQWFVATDANVHGIEGPALPDADGNVGTDRPIPMLAGYHQLLGIWVG